MLYVCGFVHRGDEGPPDRRLLRLWCTKKSICRFEVSSGRANQFKTRALVLRSAVIDIITLPNACELMLARFLPPFCSYTLCLHTHTHLNPISRVGHGRLTNQILRSNRLAIGS